MRLRRTPVTAAALLLLAGLLAGCAGQARESSAGPSGEPTVSSERGRILEFRLPSLQGVEDSPNALNIARHASPDAPLLLFLPATRAKPDDYRAFLDAASDEGYSVLGLDYFNRGKSLTVTCGPDARCYDRFQRNRFTGADPSEFSRVDAANSILSRLKEALHYLDVHDAGGGWGRFLEGRGSTGIRWSDVVVAGHSQGGGESAFISHYHRVQGVLMFSAPVETFQDVSAQWMETPGKTPPSRMYGFDLNSDVYHDRIVPSWAKLGMGQVSDDQATGVPVGSHTLLSDRMVGTPLEAHGRSVSDGGPRRDGGTPVFRPTWEWMLRQVR